MSETPIDHPGFGFCPMGCGETLRVVPDPWFGHAVACSSPACPSPSAVTTILRDDETEHLVEFGERTFTVKHPLRERLDDALMTCKLHDHIEALDGPPVDPGRYRAVQAETGEWTWVPLPESPGEFEDVLGVGVPNHEATEDPSPPPTSHRSEPFRDAAVLRDFTFVRALADHGYRCFLARNAAETAAGLTDHRARIVAALEDAYEGIDPEVDLRHVDAADAIESILRDLTRDLSEQVARLKLADADRAARELLGAVGGQTWGAPVHGGPIRPAPDAVSTPAPVPASDDAQRGVGEAHSGSQGAGWAAVVDSDRGFHGFEPRRCGEHRSVGSHRAWCHDCSEWCYPASPCERCQFVGGSQGSEVERG